MSSSVWVLCPNGRRVSVAFGPNSPLNSIKQQVSTFDSCYISVFREKCIVT